MRVILIVGLLCWVAAWSQSPISRADLAVRLIETEACWEAHRESPEARLRATRLPSGERANGDPDALCRR